MDRIPLGSRCGGDVIGMVRSSVDMEGIRIRNEWKNDECRSMNAECGRGDGFYSQVVAQESGNAQAVKRGNFGGKEEMKYEK